MDERRLEDEDEGTVARESSTSSAPEGEAADTPAGMAAEAASLEEAKQNVSAAAAETLQEAEQASAAATAQEVRQEKQGFVATPLDQAQQEGAAAVDKTDSAEADIDSRNAQKAEETGSLRQVTGPLHGLLAIHCFMDVPAGKVTNKCCCETADFCKAIDRLVQWT